MEIEIKPIKLEYIDYRLIKDFQGNLKDLSVKQFEKMKKSFVEKGFFDVKKVWYNYDEQCFYYLDGHQTSRMLNELKPSIKKDGKKTYKIPCVVIFASNYKDAKEKLLLIDSRYGKVTQEGFEEFSFDLDDSWLVETIHYDLPNFFLEDHNHNDNDPKEDSANRDTKIGIRRFSCLIDYENVDETKEFIYNSILETGFEIENFSEKKHQDSFMYSGLFLLKGGHVAIHTVSKSKVFIELFTVDSKAMSKLNKRLNESYLLYNVDEYSA